MMSKIKGAVNDMAPDASEQAEAAWRAGQKRGKALAQDNKAQNDLMGVIISVSLGLILLAVFGSVAFEIWFSTETETWDSSVVTVWNALAVIFLVAVLVAVIQQVRSTSRRM